MAETSGRILVVDDVEENREILQRRLVSRGYEVVVADSGLTALAELARRSFDLVLLDIMMPGMDGLETLERLRWIADRGMLPVIMVSAKDESGDIVQALEMGASDYISKPIDFPVAFARIETHLALKRADDALRNSEVRSLFLAKMSHELRTPLNAIIGFSDMIAGEMLGPIENEGYMPASLRNLANICLLWSATFSTIRKSNRQAVSSWMRPLSTPPPSFGLV
jgi:CheY-like chemotaxis protein